MEVSEVKDYSFLGNDTFLNLYYALVYERKLKSEYLERQIYERSEPSIVKFIENQSEHLSKLTFHHLRKRATSRSRRAREPGEQNSTAIYAIPCPTAPR